MSKRLKLDGDAIRDWLDEEGRKHSWLARKLDVTGETVRNMLAGAVPNAHTLKALAELMGCRMEMLLIAPKDEEKSA